MEKHKLYLYLGRRDKKGLKLLTVFSGEKMLPTRVDDVKKLQLPLTVHKELDAMIYAHRLEWEPWIESAESYHSLKKNMHARGYSNIPVHTPAMLKTQRGNGPVFADMSKFVRPVVMVQKPRL